MGWGPAWRLSYTSVSQTVYCTLFPWKLWFPSKIYIPHYLNTIYENVQLQVEYTNTKTNKEGDRKRGKREGKGRAHCRAGETHKRAHPREIKRHRCIWRSSRRPLFLNHHPLPLLPSVPLSFSFSSPPSSSSISSLLIFPMPTNLFCLSSSSFKLFFIENNLQCNCII